MAGATQPCTSVHDYLNQQAPAFNATTDATIGGKPRERRRAETLETLIDETEHPRYNAATTGPSWVAPPHPKLLTTGSTGLSDRKSLPASCISEMRATTRSSSSHEVVSSSRVRTARRRLARSYEHGDGAHPPPRRGRVHRPTAS
jgi:hypothetical protein